MAQLTKAQLIDQLAQLRAHCDRVETERDSIKAQYDELCDKIYPVENHRGHQRDNGFVEKFVGSYVNGAGQRMNKFVINARGTITHRPAN